MKTTIPTVRVTHLAPGEARLVDVRPEAPIRLGTGELTFVCCGCGMPLLVDAHPSCRGEARVFRCGRCEAVSRLPE